MNRGTRLGRCSSRPRATKVPASREREFHAAARALCRAIDRHAEQKVPEQRLLAEIAKDAMRTLLAPSHRLGKDTVGQRQLDALDWLLRPDGFAADAVLLGLSAGYFRGAVLRVLSWCPALRAKVDNFDRKAYRTDTWVVVTE